ncbi:hypothetical protein D3C86_1820680 [compost metagenome]
MKTLEHHAGFLAHDVYTAAIGTDFCAVDDQLACLIFLQAVYATNQSGFAAPGRSANDDSLALAHFQVNAVKHGEVGVPLLQVAHDHHGLPGRGLASGSDAHLDLLFCAHASRLHLDVLIVVDRECSHHRAALNV